MRIEWKLAIFGVIVTIISGLSVRYMMLSDCAVEENTRLQYVGKHLEQLNKQMGQQQESINWLTVNSTRRDEQRTASQKAIQMLSITLHDVAKSNNSVALAVNGFGVRLKSVEGEVTHLRSVIEREVLN